jgi:transposase
MSRTVAVDLAKSVFQVAVANPAGRILQRHRFSRKEFAAFLRALEPAHPVMEARGTAHHWGRLAQQAGHRVSLLPPRYVRPYVRRDQEAS